MNSESTAKRNLSLLTFAGLGFALASLQIVLRLVRLFVFVIALALAHFILFCVYSFLSFRTLLFWKFCQKVQPIWSSFGQKEREGLSLPVFIVVRTNVTCRLLVLPSTLSASTPLRCGPACSAAGSVSKPQCATEQNFLSLFWALQVCLHESWSFAAH